MYDVVYIDVIRKYKQILKNRNIVLKEQKFDLLEMYDIPLVKEGLEIQKRRKKAIFKFNTIFTNRNSHRYKEIIDIAESLNIPLSTTSYAYPQVRLDKDFGENTGRMSPLEAAQCTINCEKYRFRNMDFSERAKRILEEPDDEKCDRVSCRAGRAAYWITSEGFMQPCGLLPKIQINVLEKGFEDAWNELVAQVKEIRLPKKCVTCQYSKICNACAAMCFAETGHFDQVPDYICQLSKGIYDLTEKDLKEQNKTI